MQSKYYGRTFICAKCGRNAITKKEDVDKCSTCRSKKNDTHLKCHDCGRRFFSTKGKTLCRHCFSIKGHFLSESYRRKNNRFSKDISDVISRWSPQIKILLVKMKWNLLNQVDIFKVAHIYMECIDNENKYSSLEVDEQVQYMLMELEKMMTGNFNPSERAGRRVLQIDATGAIIKEFCSMNAAARELKVHLSFVKNSCNNNGYIGKKFKRLRFRYKD